MYGQKGHIELLIIIYENLEKLQGFDDISEEWRWKIGNYYIGTIR